MKLLVRKKQRGDTLIEVTLALVIIGIILFSAYSLGTKAFQLGQTAKERSQAAEVLQAQAEGLRSLRDNEDWGSFENDVKNFTGNNTFHMEFGTGVWVALADDNSCTMADGSQGWDPHKDNSALPNFYCVQITGKWNLGHDIFEPTIAISWQPLGSGPDNTSTLYTHLTNPDIFNTGQ